MNPTGPIPPTTDPARVAGAYLAGLARALEGVPPADMARAAAVLAEAARRGGRVYTCGNGGSAATASHMVIDLAKQAAVPGRPRIRAFALCDNVPSVTAWSNDEDYAEAFARQLEALVEAGDVLVAISTSGRSPNVLRAAEVARGAQATVIALTGADGGALRGLADCCIAVPSDDIGHVEDAHLAVNHALAVAVRALLA